jgi:hypothetical protein
VEVEVVVEEEAPLGVGDTDRDREPRGVPPPPPPGPLRGVRRALAPLKLSMRKSCIILGGGVPPPVPPADAMAAGEGGAGDAEGSGSGSGAGAVPALGEDTDNEDTGPDDDAMGVEGAEPVPPMELLCALGIFLRLRSALVPETISGSPFPPTLALALALAPEVFAALLGTFFKVRSMFVPLTTSLPPAAPLLLLLSLNARLEALLAAAAGPKVGLAVVAAGVPGMPLRVRFRSRRELLPITTSPAPPPPPLTP